MTYIAVPGYMPTYKLPLPCRRLVSKGLHLGMSVYVQGIIPYSTNSFQVNFYCGSNIALHFNPRFKGQNVIWLNSVMGGKWGKEESHPMPLQLGQPFGITFIICKEDFQILVNRNPFCKFKHRIPAARMQEVNAVGDVELQSLTILGRDMKGGGPFLCRRLVPKGLHPGMSVYVQGIIPYSTNSFQVNFYCGSNIALHFNPRFKGQNVVCLNSVMGGKWGKEESHSMPLELGEPFGITFIIRKEDFQILVNRNPFCKFKHRIPAARVEEVNVDGDVELQSLTILGGT